MYIEIGAGRCAPWVNPSWIWDIDMDKRGGSMTDRGFGNIASDEDCQIECEIRLECRFYTYSPDSERCYLWTEETCLASAYEEFTIKEKCFCHTGMVTIIVYKIKSILNIEFKCLHSLNI